MWGPWKALEKVTGTPERALAMATSQITTPTVPVWNLLPPKNSTLGGGSYHMASKCETASSSYQVRLSLSSYQPLLLSTVHLGTSEHSTATPESSV